MSKPHREKEDLNELYTYCAKNLKNLSENLVEKIGSDKISDWKKEYTKYLHKTHVANPNDSNLDVSRIYCDPDSTYSKKLNHHFFEQLTDFLDKREKYLKDSLCGSYKYEFIEDKGIKVTGRFENKNIDFYLRSDLLGFSKPSNKKDHPYDLYIKKSQEEEEKIDTQKALENVTNWIVKSRTIGGSFLWPRPFYDDYNRNRGGKFTSNRRYYIQDRVDLTLWEIRDWYNSMHEHTTILKRCEKEASNLRAWLSHFRDFKTFVEFFCFGDFVDTDHYPIDMIEGEKCKPEWKDSKNPDPKITEGMKFKEIEKMLEELSEKILSRSKKIEEILGN